MRDVGGKNVQDQVEELLAQARLLPVEDQLRLLGELIADLKEGMENIQPHSITELRGVGKELWQGIDVEKYIEEERSSWDG